MKLAATAVAFAYSPEQEVLRSVSLLLGSGQVMFILGANGTGKTTLLECLSGLRAILRGSVMLDSVEIHQLSPPIRARHIGLVPQLHEPVFEFTVEQAVLMGRAPHLGLFGRPGPADFRVVGEAIESVGIAHLSTRPYTKISGGERQLALIARGLAQGARCLLMDEPVAHLDPHHQHEVLSIVRRLADQGFSFAITSHLPNHALLYADWAMFLIDGMSELQGPPATTITEESLRIAYQMDFEIVEGQSGTRAVLPRMLNR
ncbi:MAG: ABC transporter ATP-binding protein [Candidatus Atribacteria bacterium]|nr:MAG: ABC transporter ATP-binding protein [Candidatus Atribacteria bacterium]